MPQPCEKKRMLKENRTLIIYIVVFSLALVISGISPKDRFTWLLEVLPALIAFGILAGTFKRFRFTNLVYFLLLVHSLVLMIGGHWTYAEVPLFNWLRDMGIFARNNYDKVGHFMQGFAPVLVAREILIRNSIVNGKSWTNFLSVSVVLAASACYEFFEWWISLLTGGKGDAFLGTQGYVWDTQSDMFLCLVGAGVAILLLVKTHDNMINGTFEQHFP
ncbi:putative membrane protein [Syntrophus gentianae]|uniref:Putative membrane protein n=2 Tax=Syntrophus gentianae TaxID=43775 RepID=A0A1H7VBA8_9BACT|nr:putative membrane protein [Syntrophus gentianae]